MNISLAFNGVPAGDVALFRDTLKEIIRKDSGNNFFGFSEDFLNMECTDIDRAIKNVGGNNASSMDYAVSIGNYDAVNQSYSNPRWLLVELKLNATVTKSDPKPLEKKVKGTERFIINVGSLDNKRFFIYSEYVHASQKHIFDKWKNGSNGKTYKNWECLSPKIFENYLLVRQNIKYESLHKAKSIEGAFQGIRDVDSFSDQLSSWLAKAEGFRNQGNQKEYYHIMAVIARIYKEFRDMIKDDTDGLLLDMEWGYLNDFL